MSTLEIGQIWTVHIDGYNHRGEGVCRVDGFTIFVPFSIMHEEIEIVITVLKKNYGVGKIMRIVAPSADRTTPLCPVFTKCGGCQLQHVAYEAHGKVKGRIVQDVLQRIGGVEDKGLIRPILMAESPWYYRNKAQVPVARQHGQTVMGFYQSGTHRIVETSECFIQHQNNNNVLQRIKDLIHQLRIQPYEEETGTGDLRYVVVRHSAVGETMIIIVTAHKNFPKKDTLFEKIQREVPDLTSLYQNINSSRSNVIFGEVFILVFGESTITDRIGPFRFNLSPRSFFQVNPEQTERIYRLVLDFADPKPGEVLVDAYCGIGTISLYLAQKGGYIYGIEVVQEAVDDAKNNAERNEIYNVEFVKGKVESVLPELKKAGIHVNTLVIDPPRKGCDPSLIDLFSEMAINKIVYVSCNPASLARDIQMLQGLGYKVQIVQPVDQFPQTSHVETVALITRIKE